MRFRALSCPVDRADCSFLDRGALSANARVSEGVTFHFGGVVDITQIDKDRRVEQALDALQIESAELVPFGDDDKRVGLLAAGIGIVEIGEVLNDEAGLLHAFGIESLNLRAMILKRGDDRNR